ncbi:hypothetical protein EON67_11555 [archaeon]|nr:MAG: hypothetical protein EON67_11555 [archaeon]
MLVRVRTHASSPSARAHQSCALACTPAPWRSPAACPLPRSRTARRAEVEDREKRVDVALRAGRNVEAAQIALHNPPFGSKDAGLKDRNTVVVMKALTALGQKDADIHALLAALDTDLADNLMKVGAWG